MSGLEFEKSQAIKKVEELKEAFSELLIKAAVNDIEAAETTEQLEQKTGYLDMMIDLFANPETNPINALFNKFLDEEIVNKDEVVGIEKTYVSELESTIRLLKTGIILGKSESKLLKEKEPKTELDIISFEYNESVLELTMAVLPKLEAELEKEKK